MQGNRPLSKEEVTQCINSFKGKYSLRNKTLFVIGLNTGFRISELLSLKIKDAMPYSKITDYLTVKRENMKGHYCSRTIVLNELSKEYLKKYLDNFTRIFGVFDKDLYLFKSQKTSNKAISRRQATKVLKDVYCDNELTGTLATHAMRKTFAKNVNELLDKDITKTQLALGHKNVSSTQRYLSFDIEDVNNAIKKMGIESKLES
jgi:site-specific recombinase XerD